MKVAIIHARGGSKRIPKKNIKLFCGNPMLSYPINVALKSGLFDKVVVSTDFPDIADIAKQYGADVPYMRPAELADDQTTTEQVLAYDMQQFENLDYACCIYATSPFLTADGLKKGLDIIQGDKAVETVLSVTTFSSPIFRAFKLDEKGCLGMFWPEYRETRSQDLPEAYHDAGQFYWVNVPMFQKNHRLYSSTSKPVILPRYPVHDIDTPEDWERAEYMYKTLSASGIFR